MTALAYVLLLRLCEIIFAPSVADPSAWDVFGLACLMSLAPLALAREFSR